MNYAGTLKASYVRLQELETEYAEVHNKLAAIGAEISSLTQVISALAPLAGETPKFSDLELLQSLQRSQSLDLGITDRIRQIMEAKPTVKFTPTGMRRELENAKFDLNRYSNPMATIHGVLKRLVEQRYAQSILTADDKTVYVWNQEAPKR